MRICCGNQVLNLNGITQCLFFAYVMIYLCKYSSLCAFSVVIQGHRLLSSCGSTMPWGLLHLLDLCIWQLKSKEWRTVWILRGQNGRRDLSLIPLAIHSLQGRLGNALELFVQLEKETAGHLAILN